VVLRRIRQGQGRAPWCPWLCLPPLDASEPLNQAYQLLAVLTVLGFALAAWEIYRGGDWWIFKGGVVGSPRHRISRSGLVVLAPWWFAVETAAPGTTIAVNALLLIWDVAARGRR